MKGRQIRADIEQAKPALDQRQADLDDQRGVVELQVRSAYSDLEIATTQVEVAKSNRDLGLKTLRQSQDRFAAGATDTVEVVQSQHTLGEAAQDFVSALYAENLARISLACAMRVDPSGTPVGTGEPPAEKERRFIIIDIIVATLLLVAILFYLHSLHYVDTDDAQVDTHLAPIVWRVNGPARLSRVQRRCAGFSLQPYLYPVFLFLRTERRTAPEQFIFGTSIPVNALSSSNTLFQ